MDYLTGIWPALKNLMRTFNVYDAFDILIVAFLIYSTVKIVRDSRAGQLVRGIVIILAAYFFACQLHFKMLSTILSNFVQFTALGLLVVFQPELRRALEHIGRSKLGDYWSVGGIMKAKNSYAGLYKNLVNITWESVISLSDEKMGALIVFERKTKLDDVINTGTLIKSRPSAALICNIFYRKAPLHDGALIVKDGTLYAGGCILPLTKNQHLSKELGTRHRAAIGISENSDAVAVVVSEETGRISIAVNGTLKAYDNAGFFKKDLEKLLLDQGSKDNYRNIISSFRKVMKNG